MSRKAKTISEMASGDGPANNLPEGGSVPDAGTHTNGNDTVGSKYTENEPDSVVTGKRSPTFAEYLVTAVSKTGGARKILHVAANRRRALKWFAAAGEMVSDCYTDVVVYKGRRVTDEMA